MGKFNFQTRRVLLNSGWEMPILGLGTYALSDRECEASINALLEAGGRLIDTAHAYGNEAAVGRAVRRSSVPRGEIFVTTKIYPDQFSRPGQAVREAFEKTGLDYIDMILLHHPGPGDLEVYKALEKEVDAGRVRSIGLSNWYVKELKSFLPKVRIRPALVQNEIHPYYQENDVIPFIQQQGIGVQGWYPLGGRGYVHQLLADPVLTGIARAHGVSATQVVLRWNLQKGVIVIPGSRKPAKIRENLDLFGFSLSSEEMERIRGLDRGEKHDWY